MDPLFDKPEPGERMLNLIPALELPTGDRVFLPALAMSMITDSRDGTKTNHELLHDLADMFSLCANACDALADFDPEEAAKKVAPSELELVRHLLELLNDPSIWTVG